MPTIIIMSRGSEALISLMILNIAVAVVVCFIACFSLQLHVVQLLYSKSYNYENQYIALVLSLSASMYMYGIIHAWLQQDHTPLVLHSGIGNAIASKDTANP